MAIITLAFSCIVAGVVIDQFGACKTFTAGCALLTYGSAGFFVGIMGGMHIVMVHTFTALVRFSGIQRHIISLVPFSAA